VNKVALGPPVAVLSCTADTRYSLVQPPLTLTSSMRSTLEGSKWIKILAAVAVLIN